MGKREAQKKRKKGSSMGMSLMGKIFFASAGAYIAGDLISAHADKREKAKSSNKLTDKQLSKIADALISTKEFQQEFSKPGATVNSVMEKLDFSNISKDRFEQITGRRWPAA